MTINNATAPLRAAKVRENQKNAMYLERSRRAGYGFVPIVCESYGAWGSLFVEFFKKVMKHAAEARGIKEDIIATYWKRRIAVALHKAIAFNILSKVRRSKAGPFRDESNYELVVQDQGYFQTD